MRDKERKHKQIRHLLCSKVWNIYFIERQTTCVTHETKQTGDAYTKNEYIGNRQTSNISRTLVSNKLDDHSNVAASPVGAAPTIPSFAT